MKLIFVALSLYLAAATSVRAEAKSTSLDLKNSTLANNATQNSFSDNSQRSMDTQAQKRDNRARAGRMLDLDHLAGDINKDEKMARERSLSGQRQSRILSDDSTIGSGMKEAGVSARSKKSKSSKKKMAIKGFIPIVSLEHAKDGKQYDNPLDMLAGSNEDSSDETDEQQQDVEQAQQPSQTQSLVSSYGGQTSIGHATFGLPHSVSSDQAQASQQWQPTIQNAQQDEQSESARANRKLLGGAGILGAPKRFVSSLVPSQQLLQPVSIPQLNGPSNLPYSQMGGSECVCVPFFQCKNGYLAESQLSRSQLSQLSSSPSLQIPRTASTDLRSLGATQPQQLQPAPLTSLMSQLAVTRPTGTDQQQQMVNDIYEQLRKNIESENLEQQLQQQQNAAMYQLNERTKSTANSSLEDLTARSILNTIGRRVGAASLASQQRCGIMRTCCKLPPQAAQLAQQSTAHARLIGPQYLSVGQQAARPQAFRSDYQMLPVQSGGYLQQSNQLLQTGSVEAPQSNNLAVDYLTSPSSSHTLVGQQSLDQVPIRAQQQQQPAGVFMGGRCGVRTALGIAGRVQNGHPTPGTESQAEFGEFPAHAAILKRLSPGDSLFVCSAVLVSNQWLATAAHCVRKMRPDELKVRLGEWDVNRDDEFYPFVETHVRDIIVHPEFQSASLVNDLALLRLEQPVDAQQMPHVAPACLASQRDLAAASAGQRCWVAGWGKDAFGASGTFQSILKKVDLPVVGRQECENALRYQTKLGKFFRLHSSAICAGGERGKDACEGDGGAGLYCSEPETGLTKVLGLVSWGVGCGQVGVPGVYTNLAALQPWIESVIAGSGEENLYQLTDRSTNLAESYFKSIINERSNLNATEGTSQQAPAATDEAGAGLKPVAEQPTSEIESRSTNSTSA